MIMQSGVADMANGKHLTREQRIVMEALLNNGSSQAEVARYLSVNRSTISREYKKGLYMHRNSDYTEEERYSADLAQMKHEFAVQLRGTGLKIDKEYRLAAYLEEKIVDEKYSPEAALASIKNSGQKFDVTISLTTLYRYIDNGVFLRLTNKNLAIKRNNKKQTKTVRVQKRVSAGDSIEKRPAEIESREEFGHWEMDTVKGKRGKTKSSLLVLSERKTRDEIVIKLPDQGAASVVEALDRLEKEWGENFTKVFKTITVDNGVEFSNCDGMEASVFDGTPRTKIYYCHAYSSWERGTNENINRMIRRHIRKGVDFDNATDEYIKFIQEWINHYPRRMFGFKTSAELFEEELQKIA